MTKDKREKKIERRKHFVVEDNAEFFEFVSF